MLAAVYKACIDACFAVDTRLAGWFAPHQVYSGSPQPDLAVELDAGYIWNGTTLTEVAAQSVSGFTIPASGYQRIDRVVVDATTGVASRIAGTAQTSGSPGPSAPAITAGKIPICQVLITSADTAILDSMITDERALVTKASTALSASFVSADQTITAAGALTIAHGLGSTPTLVQCWLKCTDAGGDVGYSQNDIVLWGQNDTGAFDSRGVSIVPDATNLNIRFASLANTFSLLNKGTGAIGNITNTKWAAIFKAYA